MKYFSIFLHQFWLFLIYLNRKLKNRVAAQTARDRKKARMQDLEDAVERLEREVNNLNFILFFFNFTILFAWSLALFAVAKLYF